MNAPSAKALPKKLLNLSVSVPLGYSEPYEPSGFPDDVLTECFGQYHTIRFHTGIIADCVQVRIVGHDKGVNSIDLAFAGPIGSVHRLPDGARVEIRSVVEDHVFLFFTA
ncbi:MAG: hypothetical protein WAZ27_01235 [Minisyncoccia bacterium]